jgi:capsular polysaccharide biosynthesis protein
VAVLLFVTLFIVVALYIGAFDTRIHDLDDVARLGIAVVGQVPGFPGDEVGSLRERGVTRRGVPWSWQ